MLYNIFRDLAVDIEKTLFLLIQTASPSPDEWTEEAKKYLPRLIKTHEFMVESLVKLPEELPEHKDKYFGPRVQQNDVLALLSNLAPLAADPKLAEALYSYNPSKLFSNACLFINLTTELYWGWQKYNLGEYKTLEGQVDCFFEQCQYEDIKKITLVSFLESIESFKTQLLKGAEWDFKDDFSKL